MCHALCIYCLYSAYKQDVFISTEFHSSFNNMLTSVEQSGMVMMPLMNCSVEQSQLMFLVQPPGGRARVQSEWESFRAKRISEYMHYCLNYTSGMCSAQKSSSGTHGLLNLYKCPIGKLSITSNLQTSISSPSLEVLAVEQQKAWREKAARLIVKHLTHPQLTHWPEDHSWGNYHAKSCHLTDLNKN